MAAWGCSTSGSGLTTGVGFMEEADSRELCRNEHGWGEAEVVQHRDGGRGGGGGGWDLRPPGLPWRGARTWDPGASSAQLVCVLTATAEPGTLQSTRGPGAPRPSRHPGLSGQWPRPAPHPRSPLAGPTPVLPPCPAHAPHVAPRLPALPARSPPGVGSWPGFRAVGSSRDTAEPLGERLLEPGRAAGGSWRCPRCLLAQ